MMIENIKKDMLVNDGIVSPFVIIVYRFGSWIYNCVKIPVYKELLKIIYVVFNYIVRIISNSEIPAKCDIGCGLRIEHGGNGIIIHEKVIIGKNAVIFQQVTVGIDPIKDKERPPQIGNNVFIGAGAKIIGDIKIGDNVIIGANAVVITDMPSDVVVVGVPAKIVRHVT